MENELELDDYLKQGEIFLNSGQYETALEKFEEALKLSPRSIDSYINMGITYCCMKKYDEGENNFKKALMINRKSGLALFNMGNVSFLKDKLGDALAYYNRAYETGELNAEECFTIFQIYAENGFYQESLKYINSAIEKDPLGHELYLEKADLYVRAREYELAIETLNELDKVVPGLYSCYRALSRIYIGLNDENKAFELVKRFEKCAVNQNDVIFIYLDTLLGFNKIAKANEHLECLKENAKYAPIAKQLAMYEAGIALRLNQKAKAAAIFEKVSDASYSDEIIGTYLITYYYDMKDYRKVIDIASKAQASNPKVMYGVISDYYRNKAMLMLNEPGVKEAMQELSNRLMYITSQTPMYRDLYLYRGYVYNDLDDTKKALEMAECYKSIFPKRYEGYQLEYLVYQKMGNQDKIHEVKSEIAEKFPKFNLGEQNGKL